MYASNMTGCHRDPKHKLWAGVVCAAYFSHSFNFLVSFTLFHSTCIFCVYSMALYWPTLQFYVCAYVSFVCRYVSPSGEWYYNPLLCCDYFSLLSVVSHAFSALCMYSKFRHHPHPLGYFCATFCLVCRLHC